MSDTSVMTSDAFGFESGPGGVADGLTVGRVAALVGVSVRTLHHWDEIGLVRPSGRTWAGYRVYSPEDVARIHRVLVYRELGFPLVEVGRILDDPGVDARDHLRKQRGELVGQIERLQRMVGAVDQMLEASKTGIQLSPEQQVAIFGDEWRPELVEEAEKRWGDSEQWAQYAQRAAVLSPEDWEKVASDTAALEADMAAAMRSGVVPGSPEANSLAERHRELMSTYFDCSHAMQVCMARMFVDDPEFAAYYDKRGPGLALWLQEVLFANAAANGVDPATATWE